MRNSVEMVLSEVSNSMKPYPLKPQRRCSVVAYSVASSSHSVALKWVSIRVICLILIITIIVNHDNNNANNNDDDNNDNNNDNNYNNI